MTINKYINGLQHIGIPTLKMADSIAFYELLGFEVINRETQENGKAVIFLESNGLVIEVWENDDAAMVTGAIEHIALDTNQIDELYNEIKNLKVPVLTNGVEELHYWEKGIKYFTIQGPNKEKIEFCQINK